MTEIPMLQRETEQLAFKDRTVLGKLEVLSRAVVALLNGRGGAIWVGLREEHGIAKEAEVIEPGEWDRVWNHLVDAIEPSPVEADVWHEMVPFPDDPDRHVMKVVVEGNSPRRPFAQLGKGSARHFWKRAGRRVVAMSREELKGRFLEHSAPSTAVRDQLAAKLAAWLEDRRQRDRAGLWLCVSRAPMLDVEVSGRRVGDLLVQPELSGNRESGWNGMNPYAGLQLAQGRRWIGDASTGPFLEVRGDGTTVFECPRSSLHWKGPDDAIWPFALVEYVVSTLRLARALWEPSPPDLVGAHVAIFGAQGLSLTPYSPGTNRYLMGRGTTTYEADEDIVLARPLIVAWRDFGTLAGRLIAPIYEEFGHPAAAIPRELDRVTGELTLPI